MKLVWLLLALSGTLGLAACGKPGTTTADPTTAAITGAGARIGDASRGKVVFHDNCAACHGSTGSDGSVGPSLHGERARKSLAAAIAVIENPQPPMPKLYPGTLSRRDVDDVAAYVETL